MKEKLLKFIETIKENKTKSIFGLVSIIVAIAVVVGAGIAFQNVLDKKSNNSVEESVTPIVTPLENIDIVEGSQPVTSEDKSENGTVDAEVSQLVNTENKIETKPITSSKPSKPSNNTSTKKPQTSLSQTAKPETGVSWDGKSPIVYTYEDGTSGTTPKNNATYEVAPGIIGVYVDFGEEGEWDGKCSSCGKISGDGTGGTCVSWWTGGNHQCPNCGVVVQEDTCHTCGE